MQRPCRATSPQPRKMGQAMRAAAVQVQTNQDDRHAIGMQPAHPLGDTAADLRTLCHSW